VRHQGAGSPRGSPTTKVPMRSWTAKSTTARAASWVAASWVMDRRVPAAPSGIGAEPGIGVPAQDRTRPGHRQLSGTRGPGPGQLPAKLMVAHHGGTATPPAHSARARRPRCHRPSVSGRNSAPVGPALPAALLEQFGGRPLTLVVFEARTYGAPGVVTSEEGKGLLLH